MRDMNAHPERVIFFQHGNQRRCNALRQDRGYLGADPDNLNMRNVLEPGKEPFNPVIGQGERVSAGQKNVADVRI